MSKVCVEELVLFIEAHPDAAAFRQDLHRALATYRDELPCRPSKKERRRLKDALTARGFFLIGPIQRVDGDGAADKKGEEAGKRKRLPWERRPKPRQAQKTSRFDDWDS